MLRIIQYVLQRAVLQRAALQTICLSTILTLTVMMVSCGTIEDPKAEINVYEWEQEQRTTSDLVINSVQQIELYGGNSDNAEEYLWTITEQPGKEDLLFDNGRAPRVKLTLRTAGLYTIRLQVKNEVKTSDHTSVSIEVVEVGAE